MDALLNATIHTGREILTWHALLIEDGKILALPSLADLPANARRIDLGGGILAPGFIDLQVNGGGGVLFNENPTMEGLQEIAEAHRRFGTTALLPTLITDTRQVRIQAVDAVLAAMQAELPGIVGIHLEGPHLNNARRGVHDARFISGLNPADRDIVGRLTGVPTLITLAPEQIDASIIGDLASQPGLVIAAGHSNASYDQAIAGFAAGVRGVTHLFNAMSQLGSREPGLVGAALDDDRVWCGVIVDGHHVHDASIRIAWRAKRRGGMVLVTDAMPPVGSSGPFSLYGEEISVANGRCVTGDGTLAGSALDMASAVRNSVQRIGIPLDEALRMASAYPADAMGLSDRVGRLLPGLRADLVLLDRSLRPRATWIAGQYAPC